MALTEMLDWGAVSVKASTARGNSGLSATVVFKKQAKKKGNEVAESKLFNNCEGEKKVY